MKIKLLASCTRDGDKLCAIVAPHLVSPEHPLYNIEDVFNAIFVKGNMLGDSSVGTEDFRMDFQERLTPVPDHLNWNSLTEEQRDILEMMGFNETSWSNLEDAEMEHKLGCL